MSGLAQNITRNQYYNNSSCSWWYVGNEVPGIILHKLCSQQIKVVSLTVRFLSQAWLIEKDCPTLAAVPLPPFEGQCFSSVLSGSWGTGPDALLDRWGTRVSVSVSVSPTHEKVNPPLGEEGWNYFEILGSVND